MMLWQIFLLLTGTVMGNLDLKDYKDHPCTRPCVAGQSMVCEYNFTLEVYHTSPKACHDCPFVHSDCYRPHCVMADGGQRAILTVNRMLPGPAIHVCVDDTVVVNVHNMMNGGEGTTIHWHGVHLPPYMDGTAMINQCPIPLFSTFQYRYTASNQGTHYWHAHNGLQNADGIFGALVFRSPDDVHKSLYDYDLQEHTVIINDWQTEMYEERFARIYHSTNHDQFGPLRSLLINGKGAYHPFTRENTTLYAPYEVFNVARNKTYRMRIIGNILNNCPTIISIDNHTMTIIASDGAPVEPFEVQSFTIYSGERIDFIFETDQEVDNYWFRASGQSQCSTYKAFQLAIVRYEGATDAEPAGVKEWSSEMRLPHFNPLNTVKTDGFHFISELNSTGPNDEALKPVPDRTLYLAMDFNTIDNQRYHHTEYYNLSSTYNLFTQQINHISTLLPPAPIQTQYQDISKEMFCNNETISPDCKEKHCECFHLIEVTLGEVIEIFFIDEGVTYNSNHPFHFHGNYFRVIGIEKLGTSTSVEQIKALDETGRIKRKLDKAPFKDAVMVVDGGYTVVRLHAKNPGFWFLHCHYTMHTDLGMGLTIQVGTLQQQPKVPKNFPKCGPWKFEGFEEEKTETPENCPTSHGVGMTSYQRSALVLSFLCVVGKLFV